MMANPTDKSFDSQNNDILKSDFKNVNIVCMSYNCHGFKQSCDYIMKQLISCDIMCLSETWLRPAENNAIQSLVNSHPSLSKYRFAVFNKSGMDNVDASYMGRPFGGTAIILKNHPTYFPREIDVPSDRIVAVGLYDHVGTLIDVIVSVYLPFFNPADPYSVQNYVEAIDVLQTVLDKYASQASVQIMGDFNAKLPMSAKLHKLWFKKEGFNNNSSILYDFITSNKLCAADFMFKQSVDFTFYCYASGHFSWIDHALCLSKDLSLVHECAILSPEPCNTSDHLPVKMQFSIKVPTVSTQSRLDAPVRQVFPNWTNDRRNDNFKCALANKMSKLSPILEEIRSETDEATAQLKIKSRLDYISSAIHDACKESGCTPKITRPPKNFWCPELAVLRDKKRFWWNIWTSCGRPRSGILFSIYKHLKKQFRKTSRYFVNNINIKHISEIHHQFKNRNMKSFWNLLKKNQRHTVHSSLQPNDFASHYSNIMSDDETALSEDHQNIRNFVIQKFKTLSQSPTFTKITSGDVRKLMSSIKRDVCPGHDGITVDPSI